MTEMNGLANIIGATGTLHSLEEPPEPAEWRTRGEYEAAYLAWQARMTFWRCETKAA